MSYVYLATSPEDGSIMALYSRKYELARWCVSEARGGFPLGGWQALFRVRSGTLRERARMTELVLVDGDLIEKSP